MVCDVLLVSARCSGEITGWGIPVRFKFDGVPLEAVAGSGRLVVMMKDLLPVVTCCGLHLVQDQFAPEFSSDERSLVVRFTQDE
jgi:hypothetical protein